MPQMARHISTGIALLISKTNPLHGYNSVQGVFSFIKQSFFPRKVFASLIILFRLAVQFTSCFVAQQPCPIFAMFAFDVRFLFFINRFLVHVVSFLPCAVVTATQGFVLYQVPVSPIFCMVLLRFGTSASGILRLMPIIACVIPALFNWFTDLRNTKSMFTFALIVPSSSR